MGGMDVNARLTADTASFDSKMEKSAGVATATGRAVEKAAERARAAWAKELLAQERAAEAASQVARRKELAALRSDILTRSLNAEAAATERSVAAAGHGITQVQAASAAIRTFEGNPGIRVVERFLTTVPGLGKAFLAIAPGLGLFASVGIVAKLGEELYEAEQKGKHAGEEIARAFGEMNSKLETSNDELSLQNSRLEDEIGKLSKHPTNGLQTALAEARVEADKLQDSLAADLKQLEALLKEHEVGHLEGLISGVGATTGATKEITEASKAYERATQAQKRAYSQAMQEAGANDAAREAATKAHYERMDEIAAEAARKMRGRATAIAAQQKQADDAANEVNSTGRLFGKVRPVDLTPERSDFEDAAEFFDRQQGRANLAGTNVFDQKQKAALDAKKAGDEAAKKADELRMKAMEAHVAEWKTLAPVSSKAIYDYWDEQRNAFSVGSAQYNAIVERQASLAEEGARKAHEAIRQFIAEDKRLAAEGSTLSEKDPMGPWRRDDQKAAADRTDSVYELSAINARNSARMAELNVQEATGRTMTEVAAATELAAIHTREYGAELDRLVAKEKEVRNARYLDGHEDEREKQLAALQKQIVELQAGRQIQVQQDSYNISPPNTSLLVGATSALEDFIRATTDAGATLKSWLSTSLDSTNAGIVRELTERHTNGEHIFGNIGGEIARNSTGALLRGAEGSLLKGFGLGGKKKPTGAAGDPMHVIVDTGPSALSGLWKGMELPNVSSTVGQGGSAAAGGFFSKAAGLLTHLFVPGFADGVDGFSGGLAMVGERGPELLNLPSGAGVIPNHKIPDMVGGSGDMHFHVDARGSTDAAQTQAAVQRGIYQAAPHIVAASQYRSREATKRYPSSRKG